MKIPAKVLVIIIAVLLIGGAAAAAAAGLIDVSGWKKTVADRIGSKAKQQQEDNQELRERLALAEQQLKKEQELRRQLEEAIAASQSLEKASEEQQNSGERDYRELGDYYAGMKSPVAAAILGKMTPSVAAEILMGMDEEQAGAILASLTPEMAVQVTEMIAVSAAQEDQHRSR